MAQVKIRLRAIIQHIHLAVLEGAHGARIDIEIGIKLLQRHLKPPAFQQRAEGGGR